MRTFAPLPEPDLSLNISPPFTSDPDAKQVEATCNGLTLTTKTLYSDLCSTSDSGSSGSDLSHEHGFRHAVYNLGHREPTLSLGSGRENLNFYPIQGAVSRNFNHLHNYQPQTNTVDFKRNARGIQGVRRSSRAPRMRWTTTLHAHFVHVVQLLGGHESKSSTQQYSKHSLHAMIQVLNSGCNRGHCFLRSLRLCCVELQTNATF